MGKGNPELQLSRRWWGLFFKEDVDAILSVDFRMAGMRIRKFLIWHSNADVGIFAAELFCHGTSIGYYNRSFVQLDVNSW